MDNDFETVLNFVSAIWKLDEPTFISLIDDNAVIKYTFNGVHVDSDKEKFVAGLHRGHFANTTSVQRRFFSIGTNSPGKYSVIETSFMQRKGHGRDETGPGEYRLTSQGNLSVANGKITEIDYVFKKGKTPY